MGISHGNMNSSIAPPTEFNPITWLEEAVLEDAQKEKYDQNVTSTRAGESPPPPPPSSPTENPASNSKRKRQEKTKKIETKSIFKPLPPPPSSCSNNSEQHTKFDESSPSNQPRFIQSQAEVNNLLLKKCLNLKHSMIDLRDRFISLSNTINHKRKLREKRKERRHTAVMAKRKKQRQRRQACSSKTPTSKSKGIKQQALPHIFSWQNRLAEEEEEEEEEDMEEEEEEEERNERTALIFY